MERISKFFLDRMMLVNVLLIGIVVLGIFSVSRMNRDAFPDITMGTVVISTVYPGASASDVELNVTIPIEEALEEVTGIEEIISKSAEGVSVITVTVDGDADDEYFDEIYNDIDQTVAQVNDLPDGVDGSPLVDKITSNDMPFIEIAFTGTYETLRDFLPEVEQELRQMSEISEAELIGLPDPEINILVDPLKAKQNVVGLRQIAGAIEGRNMEGTGGTLETFSGERKIVAVNKFEKFDEVLNTPIRTSPDFTSYSVTLGDIAELEVAPQEKNLIVRNNGMPGASIILKKKKGSDVLDAAEKIYQYVDTLELPEGVSASILHDNSRLTRDRLSLTINNAILGFIFVFVMLFFVLDFHTALWTAFGIPFSLLFAFILFYQMGHTLNILTLGGFIVVIGMLVDDAIVIAEQYKTLREQGMEAKAAAVEAVRLMWMPVLAASATTILAFSAALFIGGLPGKFVWIMPLLIICCLFGSLIDAYLFLPAHISHGKHVRKRTKDVTFLEKAYAVIINSAVKLRYPLILVFIAMIVFSAFIARTKLRQDVFPQDASDGLIIEMEFPRNYTAEQTVEKLKKLESLVENLDGEYHGMSTRIGVNDTSIMTDRGSQDNLVTMFVYLTPFSERHRTVFAIIDQLSGEFDALKWDGFSYTMDVQPVGLNFGWAYEIRVVSPDKKLRMQKVDELISFLETVDGVVEIDTDAIAGVDELNIRMNYDMISRARLTVKDVLTTLRIAFDGLVVSSFRESDMERDYRLRLNEQARADREFIEKLPIANANNLVLNLEQFVSIDERMSEGQIMRYNGKRATTVFGSLDKQKISGAALYEQIQKRFPDSKEVSFIYDGEPSETKKVFQDLGTALIASVILIFLVLALVFNSFKQPLIILLSLPFCIPGVILAVYLHGFPLSIFVGLAVIGLVGIVINDSIVLIDQINKNRTENPEDNVVHCVKDAARRRLRPILLSTFTTVLGLIPTGYAIGGYDPFLSQMCVGMLYGLIYGTLISLIVVPLFYIIGHDFFVFFSRLQKLSG